MFLNLNIFFQFEFQEQVKKAFCYQKLFWPFTVWNCFANSWPSASNFKSFPRSLNRTIFLIVGRNNFGNKIQFLTFLYIGIRSLVLQSSLNRKALWILHWLRKKNQSLWEGCLISVSFVRKNLERAQWVQSFH